MDQIEIYFLLLSDSFFANLAFNFKQELVLPSMRVFGNYNKLWILGISSAGFFAATIINYQLGKIISRIILGHTAILDNQRYKNLIVLCAKYRIILYILVAIPFYGNFISGFLGFVRSNFLPAIAYSFIAKTLYLFSILYFY